jgi:hypothetical protein
MMKRVKWKKRNNKIPNPPICELVGCRLVAQSIFRCHYYICNKHKEKAERCVNHWN